VTYTPDAQSATVIANKDGVNSILETITGKTSDKLAFTTVSDATLATPGYTYTVVGPDGVTYASLAEAVAANGSFDNTDNAGTADESVQTFTVNYVKTTQHATITIHDKSTGKVLGTVTISGKSGDAITADQLATAISSVTDAQPNYAGNITITSDTASGQNFDFNDGADQSFDVTFVHNAKLVSTDTTYTGSVSFKGTNLAVNTQTAVVTKTASVDAITGEIIDAANADNFANYVAPAYALKSGTAQVDATAGTVTFAYVAATYVKGYFADVNGVQLASLSGNNTSTSAVITYTEIKTVSPTLPGDAATDASEAGSSASKASSAASAADSAATEFPAASSAASAADSSATIASSAASEASSAASAADSAAAAGDNAAASSAAKDASSAASAASSAASAASSAAEVA
ncbi:MAG: mucin-binding protein, partial [Weissella cibaria]